MESYLNLFEHIPEDEHNHISNKIWEALDRAGIKLSQDAELSIRIYDDEYEGEYDGEEPDVAHLDLFSAVDELARIDNRLNKPFKQIKLNEPDWV